MSIIVQPIEILDLKPILDRLEAALKPTFRQVGSAADASAATAAGQVIASPSATLLYLGAAPYEVQEGSGPLSQGFDVTIGVVIGLTLAGKSGAEGLKAMQGPAALVRGALFGWMHPTAETKFRSAGESLEDFDAGRQILYSRLDFSTRVRIQEN